MGGGLSSAALNLFFRLFRSDLADKIPLRLIAIPPRRSLTYLPDQAETHPEADIFL